MPAGRPRQGTAQRVARAERILDAAGALILRWGYDKTTIDDVARAADVAKGTIYLHWRSREALFIALLRRERVGLLTDVERRLSAEPELATPAGLITALAAALDRHPVVRAVLVGDREVLGRLARHTAADPAAAAGRHTFVAYVDELRGHGLLRADLSTAEQVDVIVAVFFGFYAVSSFLPHDLSLTEDAVARLVGETVGRALAPSRRLRRTETDALRTTTMTYLGELAGLARAEYAKAVGADETAREDAG